jgi:CheY-like chemotaxis protein/PAS domain-containing protein
MSVWPMIHDRLDRLAGAPAAPGVDPLADAQADVQTAGEVDARLLLDARSVRDAAQAAVRILRAAVDAPAAWLALPRQDDPARLEVCARTGDGAPELGTVVESGASADLFALPVGDRAIAFARVERAPSAETLASLRFLGATIAAALQHVHAVEEARALTRRLQALLDLQRALASGLLEDAFAGFATRLVDEVEFDLAWLGVLGGSRRDDPDELAIFAVHGDAPDGPRPGTFLRLADSPLSPVLQSAKARSAGPAFLGGAEAHAVAPWARSAAIVPLVVHDALVGALVVVARGAHLSRGALLPETGWLLSAVAEPLAMAVQNAELVGRLRSAMRDWQTTFDVMDSMVMIVDDGGVVRRANWALARRLRTSPSALTGRAAFGLFPGQALPTPGDGGRTGLIGPAGEALRASAVALPGGGTVVVIHDAKGAAPPAPSQSYAALRRISTGSQGVRGRVLIVDDEPSILRAVSRTLARSHDVVTATDGDEALALVRKEPLGFDAVMTDVQMPRLNGVDFFKALEREFPAVADRVLFMTGGVFGAEIEAFLRGLKSRVLRKPFDPEILRRRIDERVALSRVA